MKRHQDKMSDSPTCKQQKTAKEEEVPNSLLSLPKESLQYCVVFVGKWHYWFVCSICKQIKKILANEDYDMKTTIWSNGTVSEELAELCLHDHWKLGWTWDQIWSMVYAIRELAATSRNEKVFKWALRKDFYKDEDWQSDIFIDVAENGHIKILELADRKELHWYHRKILVGAVARTNLELMDFILNKKPTKFNLSLTRMCPTEGFIVW